MATAQIGIAQAATRNGAAPLVRMTAAGVTPLEYTVLSGGRPRAKAPLVLGNEGAGVIEAVASPSLRWGSRVSSRDATALLRNGAWQEWLLMRPEHSGACAGRDRGHHRRPALPVAY